MSTATLTGLRDYLFSTLSPANMTWLGTQLMEQAKKKKHTPKPYTMEEVNAMLDAAEADFAADRFTDDDDAWDELEELLAQEEEGKTEMAEAV